MKNILLELNENNGSNYKMDVLKKHQENELLPRLLKMTYDKVAFTYGVTMKNISYVPESGSKRLSLVEGLDFLEQEFCTRNITGHAALLSLSSLLSGLSSDDASVIELVLDRSLKINVGRSNINKVFKNLIIKPPYMRCAIYSDKTKKHINFPAFVQMKADGRFVATTVEQGKVTFMARSGEEQEFPMLHDIFINLPDGVYIGELLVKGVANRSEGNGLINSDNPPHEKIIVQLWDFVELREYSDGKHKDKSIKRERYEDRFKKLTSILNGLDTQYLQLIPSFIVKTIQEALKITSDWMTQGYEGSVLKDFGNIFKDTTSNTQLKLKLEINLEMRITGFEAGNKGSKNEAYFSGVTFQNDEGTIKGRVGVTSMTEKIRDWFHENRDNLIGQIMEVQCNDITRARDNKHYALSHPRYIEMRVEKDETDTLERALEQRDSAMMLAA